MAHALSDPAQSADELWEAMVTNRHLKTGPHPAVAAAGRDMIDREARERGSVLSSAKTYLTLFQDPLIAQNTKRSDFRIVDLMDHERPVSLYVITRGSDKERLRPLVRLLFTMMARTLMGVPLTFQHGQPVMPHKHRLLMMLDEFPSLGRMHVIEDALPKCAGYGIKCFLAAQDREQMFGAYGQHQTHHRQLPRPHHLRAERAGDGEVGVRHDRHHDHREGGRDRERQPAGAAEPGEPDLPRGQPAADDAGRDHDLEEAAEGAGRRRQGRHHRGRRDGGVRRGREPDQGHADPLLPRSAVPAARRGSGARQRLDQAAAEGVSGMTVSRMDGTRRALAAVAAGAIVMAGLAGANTAGLRFNATPSMPRRTLADGAGPCPASARRNRRGLPA